MTFLWRHDKVTVQKAAKATRFPCVENRKETCYVYANAADISGSCFVWGDTNAAINGLAAYNIAGNNYIKLRDIARLFDFDVDWRDGKVWIEPDVSPYTED